MLKKYLADLLRKTSLLGVADWLRYRVYKLRNAGMNRAFLQNHPHIKFPPPYYIYETYRLNYQEYYEDGLETARELADIVRKHKSTEGRWLDWGCGPGRITRHLPDVLANMQIYGSDYNTGYIEWCRQHIKNVEFSLNQLNPPLPYHNEFFDVVSGLSIFTHLSQQNHIDWFKELYRIINKEGILLITLQGEAFREKLLKEELVKFDNGDLVIREYQKQGHRLFSTFHPKQAILDLVKDKFALKEIIYGSEPFSQEIWILKKY